VRRGGMKGERLAVDFGPPASERRASARQGQELRRPAVTEFTPPRISRRSPCPGLAAWSRPSPSSSDRHPALRSSLTPCPPPPRLCPRPRPWTSTSSPRPPLPPRLSPRRRRPPPPPRSRSPLRTPPRPPRSSPVVSPWLLLRRWRLRLATGARRSLVGIRSTYLSR